LIPQIIKEIDVMLIIIDLCHCGKNKEEQQ
jgi:hypothetical protein